MSDRDESGPNEPGTDGVGSVAEEAAKLADALSGWAGERSDGLGDQLSALLGQAGSAWSAVDSHIATDDGECRYCPVCRAIGVWRETSPEVKEHLGHAAASAVQALAAALHTVVDDGTARGGASGSQNVEHITLDDDPDTPPQDPR